MSRLSPALLYLTIYNPTLKPSSPVSDDDEDAEEQAHILFYTSRERAVSRDKMLRQVGLAKALVKFSEMFVPEDACDNVHSQSRRMFMVSPEPGFWIHTCIEPAKTPRPQPAAKGKGKAGTKAANKGKNGNGDGNGGEGNVVYDYHEGSVHDFALRAQVLRGYEEFKLTHGSFASILGALGRQALELQLERFFTVWAWKWDIQTDSDFGNSFGVSLHPLHKSISSPLDDFVLDHPFLKDCAPFVLAHTSLIPSADYSKNPPPPALPLYVRSRLRITASSPLFPGTPSEHSPITPRPAGGTDIFASSMNATREAMEATGHAFVTIGASMDVRKWNWPGYLTFNKGVPPKTAPQDQDQPADAKDTSEETPAEAIPDDDVAENDSVSPDTDADAGLRGEVDTESLHEAMSTDGRELLHKTLPLEEENGPAMDSTSQTEEIRAVVDVTPQAASECLQDEQDPSPPSPSTPIVHPPDLTSPSCLSSSQSTITSTVPVAAPSFRSFSLHFSSHGDPLATAQRRVLYITKEQLTFAFLEPTISDDDNTALYQAASALLANVQGLMDHEEASHTETPITAAKILQPKDKYLIAKGNDTTVMSAEFTSHSEHLYNGSQMIANGDATEVFSRTQGPQHWHVARREPEGTVYLEVLRKETSLADVENELVGIVRRFRGS